MQCPNCGKPMPNNARSCAHCGMAIINRMQQQPSPYNQGSPNNNAQNAYRQGGGQYYNNNARSRRQPNVNYYYGAQFNGFGIGGLVAAIFACLISFIGFTRMFGFPIFGLLCAVAATWLTITGVLKQYSGRVNVERPISNAFNWVFNTGMSSAYKAALIVSLSGILLNVIFLIVSIVKYVSHPSIWDYL